MLFRKASEDTEARILTLIGFAFMLCATVVAAVLAWNPGAGKSPNLMNVVIEAPYVGEGVRTGTALLLRGVQVGAVSEVTNLPDGGVRLATDLERTPTVGLTDTMRIDYRPANYFGITGINIRPGNGGRPLADGSLVRAVPAGNFTLQALLQRLGESNDVLTPQLIDVAGRTATYLDGLDPLLETMLVVANSFATVQTVSTAQLLTNATGISVAFPGFLATGINVADAFLHGALNGASEDYYRHTYLPTIDLVADDLFGATGRLFDSHSIELAPVADAIKVLTDVVPGVIPSAQIADTLREWRLRLERLFGGSPDRRAVNVQVILDDLPGVAAPLNALGISPPAAGGNP